MMLCCGDERTTPFYLSVGASTLIAISLAFAGCAPGHQPANAERPPSKVVKKVKDVSLVLDPVSEGGLSYTRYYTKVRFADRGRVFLKGDYVDDWKPGDSVWLIDNRHLELIVGENPGPACPSSDRPAVAR